MFHVKQQETGNMVDLSKYAAGKKRYMSKDLWEPGAGENLTIANITEALFTDRNGKTEHKLVVDWVEDRPPLTLNVTNLNWLLGTFGPREEHWQGKRVRAFHDPTVKYGGKLVGGVVLDKTRPKTGPDPDLQQTLRKQQDIEQATGVKVATAKKDPFDDDIPF
jgi:hypothetical protein